MSEMGQLQLSLWEEEKLLPIVENWIECIHYDGSREIVSTLDPTVDWYDRTVYEAGFTTEQAYQEYKRRKQPGQPARDEYES